MKLGLTLLAVVLTGLVSPRVDAQFLKPIDPTKQADVNGKSVNYGDVQFDSLPQRTTEMSGAPLSKGDLKFQDLDQKRTTSKTLEMSIVSMPTLSKANFTAKRAAIDTPSDETKKQAEQTKQKAKINERQIRAFTPAGEEELKRQLNEPALAAH